jgi:hypothetical protein
MKKIYFALILVMVTGLSLFSQTVEVEVTPMIDNTMFRDSDVSNGLGEFIFTGNTNKDVKKRALVKFDLTETVPEGTTVDSVSLTLIPTKVKPGSTEVEVFILTTEWGEGTSKAEDGDGKGAPATKDDATWSFAKFSSFPWVKKGGDFAIESSASNSVSEGTDAVFRSDQLTLDVNFWLKNPSLNFGWILIGDESKTATSVKFVSKDHDDNEKWPTLKLYYTGATSIDERNHIKPDLLVYQGSDLNNIYIVNGGETGSSKVEIFSITGTRIFSNQLELLSGKNKLITGIQKPGIYIYRISLNGNPSSGKLLIADR